MLIRRATKEDLGRINDLLRQILEVHATGRPDIFISGRKKYNDDELIAILQEDSTPVFVAEDETGFVVGYAFCELQVTKDNAILQDRTVLFIDDLCVDEACRGKHIGTALFEHVSAFAKESGCDGITLNVWSLNESAMRFYEKCGLTPLKVVLEKKITQ